MLASKSSSKHSVIIIDDDDDVTNTTPPFKKVKAQHTNTFTSEEDFIKDFLERDPLEAPSTSYVLLRFDEKHAAEYARRIRAAVDVARQGLLDRQHLEQDGCYIKAQARIRADIMAMYHKALKNSTSFCKGGFNKTMYSFMLLLQMKDVLNDRIAIS